MPSNKEMNKRWWSLVDSYKQKDDNESNYVYRVLLAKTPNILRFTRTEVQKACEDERQKWFLKLAKTFGNEKKIKKETKQV